VEVWDHEARLTPTFSIEVPVTSQKMSGEVFFSILPVSTIFGPVQIVWHTLYFIVNAGNICCYAVNVLW